ncbi:hypothetical protein PG993_015251 [Apiospora rasikravindrae]|uniref:Uncharacterized protein n=1 Tax=Apiospora rasikravindrae TaxID=990691 RepID=A0ABR1RQF6_9PEZI
MSTSSSDWPYNPWPSSLSRPSPYGSFSASTAYSSSSSSVAERVSIGRGCASLRVSFAGPVGAVGGRLYLGFRAGARLDWFDVDEDSSLAQSRQRKVLPQVYAFQIPKPLHDLDPAHSRPPFLHPLVHHPRIEIQGLVRPTHHRHYISQQPVAPKPEPCIHLDPHAESAILATCVRLRGDCDDERENQVLRDPGGVHSVFGYGNDENVAIVTPADGVHPDGARRRLGALPTLGGRYADGVPTELER